jgi:hypothetical protein
LLLSDLVPHPWERLLWGAVAIGLATLLGRALRWVAYRLDQRRPDEERELLRLRRRETALALVATAIPYATAIVVVIVVASLFVPAAALGGTAFIGIVVGFATQRFLMDVVAGLLIVFERWYGVGDFVVLEPTKAAGVVEQFSLRTTMVRSFNGDRAYAPNSQIIAATRTLRGYRRYSIEILTTDPERAQHVIETIGSRAPVGEARFLRPPHVIDARELGDGVWLVRGRADVFPTLEWLAESLLAGELKAQLQGDALLADPIVYTLDEAALSRYERRLLLK